MTKRPQIGHDRTSGQEIANDEVGQPLQGHIGRIRHSDACEPWGYVAPAVAAVMTRATGVRHIYLIVIAQLSLWERGHNMITNAP